MRWRAAGIAAGVLCLCASVFAQQPAPTEPNYRSAVPKELKPGEKVPLIVYLHGTMGSADQVLGSLQPLVEPWRFAILVPRGSVRQGTRPDGKPGYGWRPDVDVAKIAAEIRRMIDAGTVDPKRIYLMGFSAGASMCYVVMSRNPDLFTGVVCFSGMIQKDLVREGDLKAAAAKVPVYIVHGTQDPVMPVRLAESARDVLTKAGFRVHLLTFAGQHQVPPNYTDVLKEAIEWCSAQKAELDAKPPAKTGRKETP